MNDDKRDWLILSIKYTTGYDLVWWMPNFSGYTNRLEDVGHYTEKEARSRERQDDSGRFETVAVPKAAIEGRTSTVVPDRHMRDIMAMSSAKGQFA